MKNFITSKNSTKKVIALWLVFIMMLTPLVTNLGGKKGAKAEEEEPDYTIDMEVVTIEDAICTAGDDVGGVPGYVTEYTISSATFDPPIETYYVLGNKTVKFKYDDKVKINGRTAQITEIKETPSEDGTTMIYNAILDADAIRTLFASDINVAEVSDNAKATIKIAEFNILSLQLPNIEWKTVEDNAITNEFTNSNVKFVSDEIIDTEHPKKTYNVITGGGASAIKTYSVIYGVSANVNSVPNNLDDWKDNAADFAVYKPEENLESNTNCGKLYGYVLFKNMTDNVIVNEPKKTATVNLTTDETAPSVKSVELFNGTTKLGDFDNSKSDYYDAQGSDLKYIVTLSDGDKGVGIKGATYAGESYTITDNKITIPVDKYSLNDNKLIITDKAGNTQTIENALRSVFVINSSYTDTVKCVIKANDKTLLDATKVGTTELDSSEIFKTAEGEYTYENTADQIKLTLKVYTAKEINSVDIKTGTTSIKKIEKANLPSRTVVESERCYVYDFVEAAELRKENETKKIDDINVEVTFEDSTKRNINLGNLFCDSTKPNAPTVELQHYDGEEWKKHTSVYIDTTEAITNYRYVITNVSDNENGSGFSATYTDNVKISASSDWEAAGRIGTYSTTGDYTYTFDNADKTAIAALESEATYDNYVLVRDKAGNVKALELPKLKKLNTDVEFGEIELKDLNNNIKKFDTVPSVNATYKLYIKVKSGYPLDETKVALINRTADSDEATKYKLLSVSTGEMDEAGRYEATIIFEVDADKITGNADYDNIVVKAGDIGGNTKEKTLGEIIYDNTKPYVKTLNLPSGWVKPEDAKLTFEVVSGSDSVVEAILKKVSYSISQTSFSVNDVDVELSENPRTTGKKIITIPESSVATGTKIVFAAADDAGNTIGDMGGTNPYEAYVKVDGTKPVVSKLTVNGMESLTNPIADKFTIRTEYNDNLALGKVVVKIYKDSTLKLTKEQSYEETEKLAPNANDYFEFEVEDIVLDGSYRITVDVYDKAGNKSEDKELSFGIDNTAPEAEISIKAGTKGEAAYYRSDVTLHIAVEDEHLNTSNIVVKDNDQAVSIPWDKWTKVGDVYETDVVISSEGSHDVTVDATDNSENTALQKSVSFIIDKTEPVASQPLADGKSVFDAPLTGTPVVTSTVTDNQTLSKVAMTITYPDGEKKVVEYSYEVDEMTSNASKALSHIIEEITAGKAQDGIYTVEVTAVDKAGNEAIPKTLTFEVDNTIPVVGIAISDGTKGEDIYYRSDVKVKVIAKDKNQKPENIVVKDNGSKIDIPYEAWISEGGIHTAEVVISAEGSHIVTVDAKDNSSNAAEPKSVSFIIDKTKPVVDQPLADGKSVFDAPLTGTPTVTTTVTDNQTLSKVTMTVTYPNEEEKVVEYSFSLDEMTSDASQTLSHTIEEIADGVAADGIYSVTVIAQDKAGNIIEKPKYLEFEVDNTSPVVGITITDGTKGEDIYYCSDVKVEVVAKDKNQDLTKITVKDNGEKLDIPVDAWTKQDEVYTAEVVISAEGKHVVTVDAKDNSSNAAEPKSVEFIIDKTKPVVDQPLADGKSVFDAPLTGTPTVTTTITDNQTLSSVIMTVVYPDGEEKVVEYTYKPDEMTEDAIQELTYKIEAVNDGMAADGIYKVSVKAVDKAGNVIEETDNLVFEVDNTNPVVGIAISDGINGEDIYYRSNVSVKVVAEEKNQNLANIIVKDNGSKVEIPLDAWMKDGETYTAQVVIEAEGRHIVSVEATDNSMNIAESKSIEFIIDKTNPVIEQPLADGKFTFEVPLTGAPTVRTKITDNQTLSEITMTVLYPNGEKKVVTNTYGLDEMTENANKELIHVLEEKTAGCAMDGIYSVSVIARDKAGNIIEEIDNLSFEVDNTAPVTDAYIVDGTKGGKEPREDGTDVYYRSDVTIGFSIVEKNLNTSDIVVKDNDRVVDVTWSKTGDTYIGTYAATAEGTHTVSVAARDKSVNVASGDAVTFVLDKSTPKLSMVLNGLGYGSGQGVTYMNGNATLNVAVSDMTEDAGDLNIRILCKKPDQPEGNPAYVKTSSRSFNFEEEGDYTISLYSVDMAGNTSEISVVEFRIDKTAPELNIGGVTEAGTSGSVTTVTFNMNEAFWWDATGSVAIYRRAGDGLSEELLKTIDVKPTAASTTVSETLSESGVYRFEYTGTDRVGHRVEKSGSFTVDRNAPVVNMTGVNNYDVTSDSVTFMTEISDEFYANKKVSVIGNVTDINGKVSSIDFGSYNIAMNPTVIEKEFVADGIYDIEIVSTDVAGNRTSQKVHFIIDKTKPAIGDLSAFDGKTLKQFVWDIDLDELVSDLTVCETHLYLNGSEYDGISDIADGSYTLLVTAKDEIGHEAEKSVSFVLDTKAPTFIVTGVEDGMVKMEPYNIGVSLQLAEDELLEVSLNGETVMVNDNTANITVDKEGEYKLYMKAIDAAGNESEQTISFIYGQEKEKNDWWIWIVIAAGILLIGTAVVVAVKKNGKE